MTKRQLLLSLAQTAVNWNEGADFEWNELIHENSKEVMAALKQYYPEHFKCDEMDEDWESEHGCYSEEFYNKVGGDINKLLDMLITAVV